MNEPYTLGQKNILEATIVLPSFRRVDPEQTRETAPRNLLLDHVVDQPPHMPFPTNKASPVRAFKRPVSTDEAFL